jgi:molecular chaperone GrpE (heat shock protein)
MTQHSHPQADPPNDLPQDAQSVDPAAAAESQSVEEPRASAADQAAAADAALENRDEAMDRMAQEVEQARQRVLMAQAELENLRVKTTKSNFDMRRYR